MLSTDVPALLSTEERASLIGIACPVFSSFSLDESQWDRDEDVSSFCDVSTLGSSPLFSLLFPHFALPAHFSTLTTTRKRPGIFLSAEAQAGSEIAVFLPLACRRMCPPMFSTAGPPCPPPGERAVLIGIA